MSLLDQAGRQKKMGVNETSGYINKNLIVIDCTLYLIEI